MPEQPEIHWLWFFGLLFGFVLLCGFYGAFLAWLEIKAEEEEEEEEEKFTPTHRRTRER